GPTSAPSSPACRSRRSEARRPLSLAIGPRTWYHQGRPAPPVRATTRVRGRQSPVVGWQKEIVPMGDAPEREGGIVTTMRTIHRLPTEANGGITGTGASRRHWQREVAPLSDAPGREGPIVTTMLTPHRSGNGGKRRNDWHGASPRTLTPRPRGARV